MSHDDLPRNTGMVLTDQHVALYRDQDGGLHAISSVCTHMGCDVGWDDQNKVWVCAGRRCHQRAGGEAATAGPERLRPRPFRRLTPVCRRHHLSVHLGSIAIGERRTSTRHRVERSHSPHRDMEGSRAWPLPRCAIESPRRRSRRPGRTWGRAARRLRLSDRIVSLLAGSTAED